MQTRHRNTFTTIHTEGILLPVDLLQRVLAGDKDLGGLAPADYHLPEGEKLNEAVNRAWNRLQGAWAAFQTSRGRLKEGDPGTTLTRERWLLPLFQELGYGRLQTAKAIEIEGKSYAISHTWGTAELPTPIHLVGCGVDIEKRQAGVSGASKSSPHSLMQELLNRDDTRHWGIVSNGLRLRVLRDNASLTRQAFVEFDLEAMFSGEIYADFAVLWLVCHQSRLEGDRPEAQWLERWSQVAQEQGTRALEGLRSGVEEAIVALGQGFLAHPANQALRQQLKSGVLDRQQYFRQLLRLVYRLIFLFVAEDRDLLLLPEATPQERERYLKFYSTARLRRLAERQRGSRHGDLWQGLKVVMDLLGGKPPANSELRMANVEPLAARRSPLGLPVLGGFLFSPKALPDLETAQVDNQALLNAVRSLAFTQEKNSRRAVDYKNLGSEELGSVYESLLELQPILNVEAGTFQLTTAAGNERKTTGSYYTPSSLIQVLLDSALDPVIEDALSRGRRIAQGEWRMVNGEWQIEGEALNDREANWVNTVLSGLGSVAAGDDARRAEEPVATRHSPLTALSLATRYSQFTALPLATRQSLLAERSLLDLKVCDPACGSGHFLIAAAHRIARRLARLRSGEEEPAPLALRRALREVIARCIYGVDVNPMAVELCKVNLWLESLEPGKPLSFLDAHIQCGNSLVGVGPGINLNDLEVPDEAFNPVTGDHKPTAALLKKRNKQERAGQESLFVTVLKSKADLERWLAERARAVEAMPEETAAEVQAKAEAYRQVNESAEYRRQRQIADLWTAAFFWKIEEPQGSAYEIAAPTQGQLRRLRQGRALQPGLLEAVERLSRSQGFFHWSLEFPEIFSPPPAGEGQGGEGGFDCVLGNPPWERIKLQEEEFFAARDPEIAAAPNKAARERMIIQLRQTNPALAQEFEDAKHAAECSSKFVRKAQRYPLTAVGDVNTYALFAEHFRALMCARGRAGINLPTGIATDDTTKDFFGDLVEKRAIASLYDFENREKLFPAVDSRMKFCLLTLCGAPVKRAQFVFFATRVEHLRDERRRFSLDPAEIALFNPNTRTMPVFRTRADAELTRAIYQRVPVLVNERTGENPWGIRIRRVFDMNKSETLALVSREEKPHYVKMYEAKMIWQYDHRFGTYEQITNRNSTKLDQLQISDYNQPDKFTKPWYWILKEKVLHYIKGWGWDRSWIIGYRDITNTTNERTIISAIIPFSGTDFTIRVLFSTQSTVLISCLLAAFNSLVVDFIARQAVSGTHLSDYITKQLTFLPPTYYSDTDIYYILTRVLELSYTAYDLIPFTIDIITEIGVRTWNAWFPHNPIPPSPPAPFPWDEERRALLRAELDAYYARLYGLNRKQLRYLLDPADLTRRELEDILDPWEEVSDPLDPAGYAERCAKSDFPGETFRVLKEKELRQFGEYRTRRLVLETWEKLEEVEKVEEIVQPFQPAIGLPVEIETRPRILEITWIPITPAVIKVKGKQPSPNFRQAVGVAWLLESFGTRQSISSFDAHKYSYFLQRKNLADLDIPYREAPRGPYSPQLTYKAGAYAKNKNYWEVRGNNIARRRNIKEAVNGADKVFADLEQARQLIERLAQISKDDLGSLATIDFASRAIFDRGQAITPDNIRAYFQSDWIEKVNDPWYTDENIYRAMEMLGDLGLFEKSEPATTQSPEVEEPATEAISQLTASQATFTDFGLYKCGACGKMVMGFEKGEHEQEKHKSQKVEWKKIR